MRNIERTVQTGVSHEVDFGMIMVTRPFSVIVCVRLMRGVRRMAAFTSVDVSVMAIGRWKSESLESLAESFLGYYPFWMIDFELLK